MSTIRFYFRPINRLIMSVRIARISRKFRIKVLSAHNYESLLCSFMAKLFTCGNLKISWLCYDVEEFYRRKKSEKIALAISIRMVDQIIVLDTRVKGAIERNLHGTPISVLTLGVCPELLQLSEEPPHGFDSIAERFPNLPQAQRQPRTKLYFYGILVARRRLEDLIRAVAILRGQPKTASVILYIGGDLDFDRPYVRRLTELVERLNLAEDVVFLGSLDHDEAIAYMYNYCDIFVFPCDNQTWGLAALEAMLFGKPVIVSAGTGVSEILSTEHLAVIAPPAQPEVLAAHIKNLIDDDRLRRELAFRGRDSVRKNLTYLSTGQQLEELWGSLERHR